MWNIHTLDFRFPRVDTIVEGTPLLMQIDHNGPIVVMPPLSIVSVRGLGQREEGPLEFVM